MIDSLTLTNLHGRPIIRAGRALNIAGKSQEEVSDLEPGSLLPIRHTRRIREPDGSIREDTSGLSCSDPTEFSFKLYVSDEEGNIAWFRSDEILVVEVDGSTPGALLAPRGAYR